MTDLVKIETKHRSDKFFSVNLSFEQQNILLVLQNTIIIMKSLDPLGAKKTFIRKMLGHTAVSAIKASSLTL